MIGCVTSFFDRPLNRRVLVGPDGSMIPTPGSRTHGVNEGIKKAIDEGWPFRCLAHEQVLCDDGIKIPPCGLADIDLGTTDFYINPGVEAPAMHMSSFNGGRFNHSGMLTNAGSNPQVAIYIAPSDPDPRFGQKIIQNADISFGWLYSTSQVGCLAQIDLTHGMAYNNKRIEWQCLQGWDGAASKATNGIIVTNPGAGNALNMTHFRVGQLFGFRETGILIGLNNTNAIFMSNNVWEANINTIGDVTVTSGVTTWGSFDRFELGITKYGGELQYPIIYRPGSQNNRHLIRQATSLNTVSDSGTNNRAI
jgi:hypothetical protein